MSEKFGWWNALVHGGCLIAPARLDQHFVDEEIPWEHWRLDRVRRALERFEARKDRGLWVAAVLEDALGHRVDDWPSVTGDQWTVKSITGESIRPRRIFGADSAHPMPLFISDHERVGVGRGRRDVARAIEWLRAKDLELAIVTNGKQWRIVYAGADSEAWAESAVDAWFAEGKPAPALQALRHLLNPESLTGSLREAVLDTRRGQSELSAALGERVRQAVEQLIVASKIECDRALDSGEVSLSDLYTAGVRMVMRLVVLLFAESRELLPMSEGTYYRSYSVRGLIENLDRQGEGYGGNESLRAQRSGWPRLIALSRLVYTGSPHARLPVPEYGGELFVKGDPNSRGITRAIAALEGVQNGPTDLDLKRILDLITQAPVRIRQGRGTAPTVFPVDFSQLDTEYIGILYEGLLDYELRRVADGQPQVILNLGDQPILPLRRLENMSDPQLKDLLDKMKVKSSSVTAGEDEEEAEGEEDIAEEADDDDPTDQSDLSETPAEPADLNDRHEVRLAANAWAKRAVIAAKLLRRTAADRDIEAKAKELIADVRAPGEFFLVRFGGTRKGSGTFYTVPALAGPTVRRTLDPLIRDENGPKDPETILGLKVCDPACGSGSFPLAALRHLNETLFQSLLAHGWLKEEDGRILRTESETETPEWLREALGESPGINEPADRIGADERIKARLRRHVVERCLYGIDINPLAVELTRVALWIETMDPRLPFSFLDHKFKVGDALIGCWFDRFQDYPLLAWKREGGDASHSTSVHHVPNTWTKAINAARDPVKADLVNLIDGQASLFGSGMDAEGVHDEALRTYEQLHLSPARPEEQKRLYLELRKEPAFQRLKLAFDAWCAVWFWPADALAGDDCPTPTRIAAAVLQGSDTTVTSYATTLPRVVAALAEKHRFFHWELEYPDVFTGERQGFDAVFGNPPWEIRKPNSKEWFSNIDPLYRSYGKQEALSRQREMFRSEAATETAWLEYCANLKGISNWVKYVGEPFTGNLPQAADSSSAGADPLSGGAERLIQGAERVSQGAERISGGAERVSQGAERISGGAERLIQGAERVSEGAERVSEGAERVSEGAERVSQGAERPGAGTESSASPVITLDRSRANSSRLFTRWQRQRTDRRGYASLPHPFVSQGSADINTYKLFLEASLALVHDSGRIGLIVPSGLYTDRGSVALRDRFLDQCRWEWLFGFENRNGIFNIHRSFKFCPVIVEKGGRTESIRTAFMRRDLADWEAAEPKTLLVKRAQVRQFSPRSRALLEVRDPMDVEILETMTRNGVPLGDDGPNGWGVKYATEFHMTNDSKLFPPRERWEAEGYRADEYGHWLRGRWRPVSSFGSLDVVGVVRSRDGLDAIAVEDIEDVALPLYEGRMIGQFDFSQKGWVSGKGRTAVWRDIPWDAKVIEPQYLMGLTTYDVHEEEQRQKGILVGMPKVAFMDITSATNMRTMISALTPDLPCGNSAAVLLNAVDPMSLTACLDSLAHDYTSRARCGGLHLNWFVAEETLVPFASNCGVLRGAAGKLLLTSRSFAREAEATGGPIQKGLRSSERLRLRCILDAAVAHLYGLTTSQFAYILRDCDHPAEQVNNREFAKTLDPKGFWRVDKTQPPELRHPVLAQVAFADLQSLLREHGEEEGMRRFLGGGDRSDPANDGWLLPETLRLADYGLGHDHRAHQPQPVASVLGPRFYDWQLAQTPEESWAECRRHAENIRLIRGVGMPDRPDQTDQTDRVGESPRERPYNPTSRGKPATGDLFEVPSPTLFDDEE